MKLSDINKNLKFKIAAVNGFPAKFIQCGVDSESGVKWLKAQFKPGGTTYLFNADVINQNASISRNILECAGSLALGADIVKRGSGGGRISAVHSPNGFMSAEYAKIEKLTEAFDQIRETIKSEWDCGMFEPGLLPSGFRQAFTNRSFLDDDDNADNINTVRIVTESKIISEWYDAGRTDVNMRAKVWERAIPPMMWYGKALSDDGDNVSSLDDMNTPFGNIEDDVTLTGEAE